MGKHKILTITKGDFNIQTFRSGGPGGQHQNKTDSGVRIIHNESGARGECRNHREQSKNKKEAFKRLTESVKFKLWLNRMVHEHDAGQTIDERVEEQLSPKNIKVEVKDGVGKWVRTKIGS